MAPPESWQLEHERRLAASPLRSHNEDSVMMMMMVPAMMMIINNDHLLEGHQRLHEPDSERGKKDCNCD